ncbi:MAG: ABC transporter ATP-binding protein [Methanosarcina sp.]
MKINLKKRYNKVDYNGEKGLKKAFMLDVSFEMKNELVVLFGPSGSGKTTLLKCISGITEPDTGKIAIGNKAYFDRDKKIDLPIQKRNLGYVFQNYTLFPHMSVRKNIECGLKGWEKEAKEERVLEMLSLLRIEELETRYPSQLSGGQKQKVALARALAPKPEILLLDEPFSALDLKIRTELGEKIKDLQTKIGIPLLFITHNLEEAFLLADKILVLHEGKIQQFGSQDEIFYSPRNLNVAGLIGLSNIFHDFWVERSDKESGSVLIKNGDMNIQAKHPDLKAGDKISWGIHPENITLFLSNPELEKDEKENENIYSAYIHSIVNKGARKKLSLKLARYNMGLTAEIPSQFLDPMQLKAGDSCLIKMEKEKIAIFQNFDRF